MERYLTPLSSVGEGQDPGTPLTGFAETFACSFTPPALDLIRGGLCLEVVVISNLKPLKRFHGLSPF